MPTWTDIQSHMRKRYRLQRDEPSVLSMVWSYEDGRAQSVVVRRFESSGRTMIEIKSPFARQGGPDPDELLRVNARLPFGAIALSGDVYLVVHNADVASVTLEGFDDLLARVAGLADRLEARHAAEADEF